jgi:glycosyltransferase involved in cell wall biosynthesis
VTAQYIQKHAVSVVIPVFNEEAVIEKTIRGYHSEILGRLPGSEMIVVDDCSTDGTPLILKGLRKS